MPRETKPQDWVPHQPNDKPLEKPKRRSNKVKRGSLGFLGRSSGPRRDRRD